MRVGRRKSGDCVGEDELVEKEGLGMKVSRRDGSR